MQSSANSSSVRQSLILGMVRSPFSASRRDRLRSGRRLLIHVLLERYFTQPGAGAGDETAVVQDRAKVARRRIGDDGPRVVSGRERSADDFVEAELLRSAGFD